MTTTQGLFLLLPLLVYGVHASPDHFSGKAAQRLVFQIEPKEGPASGGTQVTITVNTQVPDGPKNIHCAFGEKVVPAQSFFASPDEVPEPSVLCQTPAGRARSTVTMRLTLDGQKYWPGPKFYYHDPVSSSTATRQLLGGLGDALNSTEAERGQIGTVLDES